MIGNTVDAVPLESAAVNSGRFQGIEAEMYLAKVYDPDARAYRVRYAIANILRDRVANEGAFRVCFEMDDENEIIRTILRRGLRNPKLRAALERSHLIDLTCWLARYPDIAETYAKTDALYGE